MHAKPCSLNAKAIDFALLSAQAEPAQHPILWTSNTIPQDVPGRRGSGGRETAFGFARCVRPGCSSKVLLLLPTWIPRGCCGGYKQGRIDELTEHWHMEHYCRVSYQSKPFRTIDYSTILKVTLHRNKREVSVYPL